MLPCMEMSERDHLVHSVDLSGEPDYFFRNSECAEKFYNDFSKRKVMLGRKVNVESLSDFEIERPFVKQEKKFNLPYIMLKHMEAVVSLKRIYHMACFYPDISYFGVALSSRERDTLTKCEQFDTAVLTRMGYRKTSRNTWVPKRQASDEDVEDDDEHIDVEVEDEPEGEKVDAEVMEFDVDADL
ncbi:hypothetical protein CJ030_MR2G022356 [Morella rubra]|uniref:Uncharacterized protein n=1 Tax=Morella rubra TaxID=262757 RepID=A0A6A1WCX8_9ROSI|nr:hypothetical protein CJ030_MR2G022356 [Morella rubra]